MKKETVLCAMLATATCATAQNGNFPASGVSADSVQTEKDSIKADKEAEIQAVTVTGHRPMYKMRNDALVTRVRNTPLAKEPTLDDVLKHIPGTDWEHPPSISTTRRLLLPNSLISM